jgi:phospholipase C
MIVDVNVCCTAVIHEPAGPRPSSQFEHSSIPATVKKLFNLKSNFLTRRDAWAGSFENYFYLRDTPRDDCPGLASIS